MKPPRGWAASWPSKRSKIQKKKEEVLGPAPGTSSKFSGMGLVWVETKRRKIQTNIIERKDRKSPDFTENQEICGRSAGIRTPGLLVPNIGLKIQPALSGAFGAVCYGSGCFPDLSAPMLPSAPCVVWVSVWVSAK